MATVAAVAVCFAVSSAWAWADLGLDANGPYDPHGAYVTDGSYVMNVGELQMNITNWGLIGSHYSNATRYSDAPSAQWPAGSGDEYLWCAGLWVGGVLLGERLVSTGQYATEIRARGEIPEDTIYEAIGSALVRPAGNDNASGRRYPEPEPNDDEDADDLGRPRIDEETLNGYDDDGDGLVDEDFGQVGNQMMVTHAVRQHAPRAGVVRRPHAAQPRDPAGSVRLGERSDRRLRRLPVHDQERRRLEHQQRVHRVLRRSRYRPSRRRQHGQRRHGRLVLRRRASRPTAAGSRSRSVTCSTTPRRAGCPGTSGSLSSRTTRIPRARPRRRP